MEAGLTKKQTMLARDASLKAMEKTRNRDATVCEGRVLLSGSWRRQRFSSGNSCAALTGGNALPSD